MTDFSSTVGVATFWSDDFFKTICCRSCYLVPWYSYSLEASRLLQRKLKEMLCIIEIDNISIRAEDSYDDRS